MLKSKQLIFLIILIGTVSFSKMAFGQISTNQEIDSLICKSWKLKIYEIDGINQELDTLSSDRFIFYPDHSLELDLDDEILNASWSYDKQTATLTITAAETKNSLVMKILFLSTGNCTLEAKEKSGTVTKIHMIAD